LHPAGTARLEGPCRVVEPEVASGYEESCSIHVIVLKIGDSNAVCPGCYLLGLPQDVSDDCLPDVVCGVGLPREDYLNGTLLAGDLDESLGVGQDQVVSLVGGDPLRLHDGERISTQSHSSPLPD